MTESAQKIIVGPDEDLEPGNKTIFHDVPPATVVFTFPGWPIQLFFVRVGKRSALKVKKDGPGWRKTSHTYQPGLLDAVRVVAIDQIIL